MEKFDVGIVGAGPGGATCAWYLARSGKRVIVFDRHPFPRDKICGDAVVPRAQIHLERLGVLPGLVEGGKARPARAGGFISPAGVRAIGTTDGFIEARPVLSIKRKILDEHVVRAAEGAGAVLRDGCPVKSVSRDNTKSSWIIHLKNGDSCEVTALVAADGSNSRIARSLGLIDEHPTAFCSRAYLSGATPAMEIDGLAFYRNDLLPGYSAIFHEADGDYNFCCYMMPGSTRQPTDLKELHHWFLNSHPEASRFVGKETQVESMRSGPLRIGGIRKSYLDGFLAVGDAAGHIDPLSGEGIQFAMEAAEIAADVLITAFERNDFSETFLKSYQDRWMDAFGHDFKWSSRIAKLLTKNPQLLDISAAAAKRKGGIFFQAWSQIMIGEKPKSELFRPGMMIPVLSEMLRYSGRKLMGKSGIPESF